MARPSRAGSLLQYLGSSQILRTHSSPVGVSLLAMTSALTAEVSDQSRFVAQVRHRAPGSGVGVQHALGIFAGAVFDFPLLWKIQLAEDRPYVSPTSLYPGPLRYVADCHLCSTIRCLCAGK
ncbi:hypothetical protein EMIT0196MI5_190040 [Pseudomonas sp. IT-196MI5]